MPEKLRQARPGASFRMPQRASHPAHAAIKRAVTPGRHVNSDPGAALLQARGAAGWVRSPADRARNAPAASDRLKKIPQPGEFNNLLSRQNSGDQFALGSGVDLIQMPLRYGLRHEFPCAIVKSAFSSKVRPGVGR